MAYATSDDVAAIWRPLTPDETAVAEPLVASASRLLDADFPDLSSRLAAGQIEPLLVTDIVATMVKRAMLGAERLGVESQSESAGPFQHSQKFSNPEGALYLTGDERRRLSGGRARGRALRAWL